ncbi:unnamed protein product [Adineta steineri]|uniref:Uncharacterized protein n=1 Tax=Adineta steineri TaxID=433720 RepID=A0A815Q4C4_9BILA|nr:unnamed protein product [Adineta steineri]CAF3547259.1 unnamed protein product [Adineta steineri]
MSKDRARRVTPESRLERTTGESPVEILESDGYFTYVSSSETESQPPNIPATPPNSNNNNSMQLITQELKESNKKMDTMITMSEKMITMTNKLFYIQIGMLSLLVVTLPTAAFYMKK